MGPPTFVNAYGVTYSTTTATKTVSVTTQAGDQLVVYGGGEYEGVTLSTPGGNGVSLSLLQSVVAASYCTAYLWAGVDNTGGTNWTLSCTAAGGGNWGFTCLVFRNSSGIGTTNSGQSASGAPSLGITTTQANSALVVFSDDYMAVDGSSRTWLTVNGITPTAGNGLELDYAFINNAYSAYGAYYNDAGDIGVKTVGLSAPGGQMYSMVGAEVKGPSGPAPIYATAWLRA